MLTESRKRRRGSDGEDPHAKRPGSAQDLLLVSVSDPGRDVWDSEQSSSSEGSGSGGVGSPDSGLYAARGQNGSVSHSPRHEDSASASLRGFHGNGSISSSSTMGGDAGVSYHHINRVLREAHFSSMQIRALPGST